MASKRLQRRRDALDWVIGHLPDASRFTTHDVMMQAEILDGAKWPPYFKIAYKRVAGDGAVSLGGMLARHPKYEKHPDGLLSTSVRGSRTRSQLWRSR